jgi:vacuolar-type H+-ATPase subunit H
VFKVLSLRGAKRRGNLISNIQTVPSPTAARFAQRQQDEGSFIDFFNQGDYDKKSLKYNYWSEIMKHEPVTVEINQSNPQLALEKILTAEIDVAERISTAKEKADKVIASAQNDLVKIKNQILSDARAKRDAAFDAGAKNAREAAEKMVATAETEAEKNITQGRQYLDEAVDTVMNFLIGQNQERK